MHRICILALVGLPAAGKTTFCNWLLSLPQHHFNVIHLCFDDFLQPPDSNDTTTERYTSNSTFNYKEQRLEIFDILEQLVLALTTTSSVPKRWPHKVAVNSVQSTDSLIICDDNHYYRSMRYKLYQFCRSKRLAYAQIYFECDLPLSLSRNCQRERTAQVPARILAQMSQRLEVPTQTHLPLSWEANTLTINQSATVEYETQTVLTFLLQSFENILQPSNITNTAKITQTSTKLHQLDVLLRRRVSELLGQETIAATKRLRANSLNAKRKEILHDFKEHSSSEQFINKDLSVFVNLLY